MRLYGIQDKLLMIVDNFLKRRQQSVKMGGSFSSFLNCEVGAPQGTKLGPILWLFYVNDLKAEGFHVVKYADDTTFFKSFDNTNGSIAPAILATQQWSEDNHMTLNTDKMVVLNVSLGQRSINHPINVNGTTIEPTSNTKFLGVTVDNKLSFTSHVDKVISQCNSRIYLLRHLKVLGMNTEGLTRFYVTNVRSILSYAAPAWF